MKKDFLEILVCPTCKSMFGLEIGEEEEGEIVSGTLRCAAGHTYPVVGGIPRFVEIDQYSASFSKQRLYVRQHFEEYRKDTNNARVLCTRTGFSRADLCDGISLDVGCGYGRFEVVVDQMGGKIVGVDMSTHSIELAYEYTGRCSNVYLAQCDLFNLPFRSGTFDRVFSIGVLHHTPDTRKAFEAIVDYVKKDGALSIWVYSSINTGKKTANVWRKVTIYLPHSILFTWCVLNQVCFSGIRCLPGGDTFSLIVPGASPRRDGTFMQRVLCDFDNLSPKYAHTHEEKEVRAWSETAGFKDVRALSQFTSMIGRRT